MLLTTMTQHIAEYFDDIKAVELIKKAGFDSIDITLDLWDDKGIFKGDYLDYARRVKAKADELNIPITQAHAPFNLSMADGEEACYKNTFDVTVKCLECCEVFGVDIMIVHPLQYRTYYKNREFLKELNKKFYNELLPYCKKYGVKIACENMWQWNDKAGHIIDSVCADPIEFNEYLDMIDSEYLVGCLDLGHCGLTDRDAGYCLRTMGGDRVKALHIHDNDFKNDSHTLPLMGDMDWDDITKALAEINYSGNFTLEADGFLTGLGDDEDLLLDALIFMEKVSRKLMQKIENYKK